MAAEEQDALFFLVTLKNKILRSIFSNVPVYINNQQIYNPTELYEHKFYFSSNSKGDHV